MKTISIVLALLALTASVPSANAQAPGQTSASADLKKTVDDSKSGAFVYLNARLIDDTGIPGVRLGKELSDHLELEVGLSSFIIVNVVDVGLRVRPFDAVVSPYGFARGGLGLLLLEAAVPFVSYGAGADVRLTPGFSVFAELEAVHVLDEDFVLGGAGIGWHF